MTTDSFQRIDIHDIAIGMYVAALDQPISNTPFPANGFFIQASEQIIELARYCQYVIINLTKSRAIKGLISRSKLSLAPRDTKTKIKPEQHFNSEPSTRAINSCRRLGRQSVHKRAPKKTSLKSVVTLCVLVFSLAALLE